MSARDEMVLAFTRLDEPPAVGVLRLGAILDDVGRLAADPRTAATAARWLTEVGALAALASDEAAVERVAQALHARWASEGTLWPCGDCRRGARLALEALVDGLALCRICGGRVGWIACPTGGWWRHETHPSDDHDAEV